VTRHATLVTGIPEKNWAADLAILATHIVAGIPDLRQTVVQTHLAKQGMSALLVVVVALGVRHLDCWFGGFYAGFRLSKKLFNFL